MWPFDIKRKKREAEERAEQRRLSEERLNAAVRRSGRSPAFSAPYGKQGSRAADDSLLNPISPLYHGVETSRWSSADQHGSAAPSTSTGHSSSADVRCTGADYASYASASDSGCGSSSSSSDSGGGGGGD